MSRQVAQLLEKITHQEQAEVVIEDRHGFAALIIVALELVENNRY